MRRIAVPERGAEALFGTHDENLRFLEDTLKVRIKSHGSDLIVEGEKAGVETVAQIFDQLGELMKDGYAVAAGDVRLAAQLLSQDGGARLRDYLMKAAVRGGKKVVVPRSLNQRVYLEQIEAQLYTIFPRSRVNKYTDFNSFFQQVADMVDQKKLILKPLSIVLMTDGVPDVGGNTRDERFRNLNLKPLEGLSRNITVRVLYTDAVTAKNWRDEVPRKRVKVWTQDAVVMAEWKNPKTLIPGKAPADQQKFFSWVKDNVDFQPRLRRVN